MIEESFFEHADIGHVFNRIPRIVLTGGQCAGKTAILGRVQERLGEEVVCVSESATFLRDDMRFKPRPEHRQEIRIFQNALFLTQIAREAFAECKALAMGARAVLLDRGTLDGAAYLPQGIEEFEELNNTTVESQLRRYSVVILVTQPAEEVYLQMRKGTSSWPCARSRHAMLERMWGRHESFMRVTTEGLERIESATHIICELVRSFPAAVTLHQS